MLYIVHQCQYIHIKMSVYPKYIKNIRILQAQLNLDLFIFVAYLNLYEPNDQVKLIKPQNTIEINIFFVISIWNYLLMVNDKRFSRLTIKFQCYMFVPCSRGACVRVYVYVVLWHGSVTVCVYNCTLFLKIKNKQILDSVFYCSIRWRINL